MFNSLQSIVNALIRGTNSKTTHYLLSYSFGLNTLKGTSKAPAVDLLRLKTIGVTKTNFLTHLRFEEHVSPFYMIIWESFPPLPWEDLMWITEVLLVEMNYFSATSDTVIDLGIKYYFWTLYKDTSEQSIFCSKSMSKSSSVTIHLDV